MSLDSPIIRTLLVLVMVQKIYNFLQRELLTTRNERESYDCYSGLLCRVIPLMQMALAMATDVARKGTEL